MSRRAWQVTAWMRGIPHTFGPHRIDDPRRYMWPRAAGGMRCRYLGALIRRTTQERMDRIHRT